MRNFKYQSMNAVHMDDLMVLLEGYGLKDDFLNGNLKCKYCKTALNAGNIFSIMRDSGNYKGVCDSPPCMQKLTEKINSSRGGAKL